MKLRRLMRSSGIALILFGVALAGSSCAQKAKPVTTEEPQVTEPKPTLEEPKPMEAQPTPAVQPAPMTGEMPPAPAEEGHAAKMKHKRTKSRRHAAAESSGRQGGSIIDALQQNGSFDTFLKALRQAGLTKMLRGKGPYTVIAPRDGSAGIGALKGKSAKSLQETLYAHIMKGRIEYGELKNMKSVQTWNGRTYRVHAEKGKVHIGRAGINKSDIEVSNGVILVADTVLSSGGKAEAPRKQPADKPKKTTTKKKK